MSEGKNRREKGGEAGSRMLYVGVLRQAAYPEGVIMPDNLIETLTKCSADEFNALKEAVGPELNQKFSGVIDLEEFNKRAASLRKKIEKWLSTTSLREDLLKDASDRN